MSYISQPYLISNELADFLEIKHGSLLSKHDVSIVIYHYIKTHNLKDKQNCRVIIPDKKLKILLNLSDSEQLTIFNLQKYLRPHYIQTTNIEPVLITEESDSDSDSDSNSDSDSDLSEKLSVIESETKLSESVTNILKNEIQNLKFNNSMQYYAVKNIREIDDTRPICEIQSAITDLKIIAQENDKMYKKLEITLKIIKKYLIKNELQ